MRRLLVLVLVLVLAPAAATARPACTPCAGLGTDDPEALVRLLAEAPPLPDDGVLFVRWPSDLDAGEAARARRLAESGATPWLAVTFRTPAPLLANLQGLRVELEALAALAGAAGPGARFQLLWADAEGLDRPAEYAFLVKRAAVAVTGAEPDAEVVSAPLPADAAYLQALFAEEVAAYLDGVSFAPGPPEELAQAARLVEGLDPGVATVVEGLETPSEPAGVLAEAARWAAAGIAISLFELDPPTAEGLAPFLLLAREFRGDLAFDPDTKPSGAREAWVFARGEDLGLRAVVVAAPGQERLRLLFPEPHLKNPVRFDPAAAEPVAEYGLRTGDGYEIEIESPGPVVLLGLERMTAEEVEGVEGLEERVVVADTRQMPVEEILRRLQAFEDAQARRITRYRATNTTHLRFQIGTGAQTVEVTFEGDFFFRQGEGFDWAWRQFYVNGVKWRSRRIPEIPLIQPEKAAALPAEITFSKEYRYRLKGTELVEGRDCWVVDFEPAVAVEPGRTLYQGTVWVDREIYARVRTRAVQLGLKGEVLSNEETTTFAPVDAAGQPAPWRPSSYFLPVRLVGQQLWSVLSATTVVEREILLSGLEVNPEDFEARRQAILESDLTMVRDTEAGLRYLVADKETGERVVQEKPDLHRRFVVGGVFYDESQDFPIPLAGFNWLWFDWRGTGTQANVFFGGALLSVALTDPSFLGSRFDLGVDAFGLAFAGTDSIFRDGSEAIEEDVEVMSPSIDFKVGRPIGNFLKLDFEYELEYVSFSRADDTADEFVIPSDHLQHGFSLVGRYNRRGYRFRLGGTWFLRDEWEPWGLPGNPDFEPDKDEFVRWGASVGKTWHLPRFLKFGAELEYVDGSNLDRFSKYGFGFFSGVRVHGYQSDRVRAEQALAAHLSYGFDVGQLFRLDLVGDAAWATDSDAGLDRELLGGAGVVGTVVGPWRTVINVDVGVALAGPDDGVSVFLTVLKLFQR